MPKLYSRFDMPPCPDPERYIAVKMGDKYMWRLKRGTIKPIKLNEVFQRNANNSKLSSPAASMIIQKLSPFLYRLETKRLLARMGGRLRRALNETKDLNYSFMPGFEIQPKYTVEDLLKTPYYLSIDEQAVFIVQLSEFSIKPQNTLATGYFLELILLHGDPLAENDLRIETDVSDMILFREQFQEEARLSLSIPRGRPWMLMLHISCMEGMERGKHPKHHRMRVIGAGGGRNSEF